MNNCPACTEKRAHAPDDWKLHPYAGHGYASGQGWTHPDLAHGTQAGVVSQRQISGEVAGVKAAPAGEAK
jgi:hypothetical protein